MKNWSNIKSVSFDKTIMRAKMHKDCTGKIEYSDEDEHFVGRLPVIADVIGFHHISVNELFMPLLHSLGKPQHIDHCRNYSQLIS